MCEDLLVNGQSFSPDNYSYGCEYYGGSSFAQSYCTSESMDGVLAEDACCSCGGGQDVDGPSVDVTVDGWDDTQTCDNSVAQVGTPASDDFVAASDDFVAASDDYQAAVENTLVWTEGGTCSDGGVVEADCDNSVSYTHLTLPTIYSV